MKPLQIEDVQQLINNTDTPCVSIYQSTHCKGVEVNEHKDQLKFKNSLNQAEQQLEELGFPEDERQPLLKPANEFLKNDAIWREMQESLVVFISANHFSYHRLPAALKPHLEVSTNFYLLPILPMMKGNKRFYLLSLTLNEVHLYDVTSFSVDEIAGGSLIPESLREVVGADYEQKTMQVRNQGAPQGGGMFHGHGEGKDDRQVELGKYLKAVARGVNQVLQDKNVPLVLATVEDHFGEIKKVNEYPHLYEKPIPGSPEHTDIRDLCDKGWEVLRSYFREKLDKRIEQYREAKDRALVDSHPESIIPASMRGKVDTLFVNESANLHGRFHPKEYQVTIHKDRESADVDLLNLSAERVFDLNGRVYTLPPEEMPEPGTAINAIYRYAE